jgi:uncharacterized protein with HEPN domain
MSNEPIEFLKHIAEECEYLISVNKNLSKDDFLKNETLKRAVVRSLELLVRLQKKFRVTLKLNGIRYNGKIWLA